MTNIEVPAKAIEAWQLLNVAVMAAGDIVPCIGPHRDLWTSEDHEERQAAANRCAPCPAIQACRAYAEAAGERFNVFGGIDRTRRGAQKRKTA